MLYKTTKITGAFFMVLGVLVIIAAFLAPLLVPKATSSGLGGMNPLSFFSAASRLIVFVALLFTGMQLLAAGQVISLIADIAERGREDNRLLKFIAKKLSLGEQV